MKTVKSSDRAALALLIDGRGTLEPLEQSVVLMKAAYVEGAEKLLHCS
jgi:hypothetical protein